MYFSVVVLNGMRLQQANVFDLSCFTIFYLFIYLFLLGVGGWVEGGVIQIKTPTINKLYQNCTKCIVILIFSTVHVWCTFCSLSSRLVMDKYFWVLVFIHIHCICTGH